MHLSFRFIWLVLSNRFVHYSFSFSSAHTLRQTRVISYFNFFHFFLWQHCRYFPFGCSSLIMSDNIAVPETVILEDEDGSGDELDLSTATSAEPDPEPTNTVAYTRPTSLDLSLDAACGCSHYDGCRCRPLVWEHGFQQGAWVDLHLSWDPMCRHCDHKSWCRCSQRLYECYHGKPHLPCLHIRTSHTSLSIFG